MRYLLLILSLTLCFQGTAQTPLSPKDSLIRTLQQSRTSAQRIETYRNLADISLKTPDEKNYLRLLFQEARRTGAKEPLFESLQDLCYAFIKEGQLDSTRYYAEILRRSGTEHETEAFLTYVQLCLFDWEVSNSSGNETLEAELGNKQQDQNNPYFRIEQAWKLGVSLYNHKKLEEAIPYLHTAAQIAEKLPFKTGAKYQKIILWQLALVYSLQLEMDKTIEYVEKVIALQERYYTTYCKTQRPFYNINTHYLQDYTFLIYCIRALPQEKTEYYMNRIRQLGEHATIADDRYNYFLAFNNYYLYYRDYKNALITNDSLIVYAQKIAPYNVSQLHEVSSRIYEVTGDHANALTSLKKSYAVRDSLAVRDSQSQLNELQVKYDVDRLNYENANLEVRNKRIILLLMSIILLASVAICVYLYRNLRMEHAIQEQFRILHQKAMESEKMKTAFINSMCHEIRTPLNAIVGFSDVIVSGGSSPESLTEFAQEIHQNTDQLVSIINSLLEVSNLDVSDDKLACKSTNINGLCTEAMEWLKKAKTKADIRYELNLQERDPTVSTNARYLRTVLEHLLENANKFTQQGSIVLSCHVSKERLRISVTDTGEGIPIEKREAVFERFVKLNSFVQGGGLGLYLCRMIVTRLAGRIYIDPTYTQGGTRVTVDLPIEEPTPTR